MESSINPARLSKSKILLGAQCQKALYLDRHHSDLKPTSGISLQAVFDQGHAVGVEARKRFPGGVLIQAPYDQVELAVAQTKAAIEQGALSIFEATFVHDGVQVKVDILHRKSARAKWRLIEVKSSTSVKETHRLDAAIQAWVVAGAGVSLVSTEVMHINTECRFPNLKNLFTRVDVSEAVREHGEKIPALIAALRLVVARKTAPPIDIGPHCTSPYACAFESHCFAEKEIPDLSVFDVPGIASKKKWALYQTGRITLDSVHADPWNRNQRRMIDASLSGKRFVNSAAVWATLKTWRFPLYFLDFETVSSAIPRWPSTKSYQQIPFQFSCHVERKAGGKLAHTEYLHTDTSDPRERLIPALLEACEDSGSIVSYNMSFEAARIKEMAMAFPGHARRLRSLLPRFVDPLPIFRAEVYDREFRGSFSIKSVAPAILGVTSSYEGMTISEGGLATLAFEELSAPDCSDVRKQELVAGLREYCAKDTMEMVKLVRWLRSTSEC